jgi:hypothetical protein
VVEVMFGGIRVVELNGGDYLLLIFATRQLRDYLLSSCNGAKSDDACS